MYIRASRHTKTVPRRAGGPSPGERDLAGPSQVRRTVAGASGGAQERSSENGNFRAEEISTFSATGIIMATTGVSLTTLETSATGTQS